MVRIFAIHLTMLGYNYDKFLDGRRIACNYFRETNIIYVSFKNVGTVVWFS